MNPGDKNGSRLDRMEKSIEGLLEIVARHDVQIGALAERQTAHEDLIDKLLHSQQQLLTAQVVFVDETRKAITEVSLAQKRTEVKLAEVTDKLHEVTDKLNALISVVDNWPRERPGTSG